MRQSARRATGLMRAGGRLDGTRLCYARRAGYQGQDDRIQGLQFHPGPRWTGQLGDLASSLQMWGAFKQYNRQMRTAVCRSMSPVTPVQLGSIAGHMPMGATEAFRSSQGKCCERGHSIPIASLVVDKYIDQLDAGAVAQAMHDRDARHGSLRPCHMTDRVMLG